jgi:autotransporter translocation and assembly factor TamB
MNEPTRSTTPESAETASEAAPKRKFVKRLLQLSLVSILGLVVASTLVIKTSRGHRIALGVTMDKARALLVGDLVVDEIRSGNLLRGATLVGFAVEAEDGRRFLSTDSVVVRFSPLGLFANPPQIASVVAWGLDLEISRYPSEQLLNVRRVLAHVEPVAAEGSEPDQPRPPLELGRISVRGGTVQVLLPASDGTAAPTVASPDGQGLLRRLAFERLDLELEDGVLDLEDPSRLFAARLVSLSSDASILAQPLRLAGASGEVQYGSAGITVTEGRFDMPGSSLLGELRVGPRERDGRWVVESTLSTERTGDLEDLQWLDPRIPSGSFAGSARISVAEVIEVDLEGLAIELEASSVAADGRVVFGDHLEFDALDLTASPLALARLEPWVGRELSFEGWLSGQARFSGTLTDVVTSGRVTLVPTGYGGAPTSADFSGAIHRGANPGATGFEARLDPLNYELLRVLVPDVPLDGTGTLAFEVTGRADDGLQFVAKASHVGDSLATSGAQVSGVFWRTEAGEWSADVEGDLRPLSLAILRGVWPDLELTGELTGTVRGVGRLRDLQISAELDAAGGEVVVDGVMDLRRPGSFYRFDANAESVPLDRFSARLPQRSVWSGRLEASGRGVRIDSMDAAATLFASQSRVGGLHIDTVTAYLRASAGILIVDSLEASLGGVEVSGQGRLGMAAPLDGEARLRFSTDSLGGLRPLLLGDTVIAKDTLSALEWTSLEFDGVDVEALPDTADVRMRGSAQGTIRLVGSVDALVVDLDMEVRGAVYGHNRVDSARVTLTANELPEITGDWDVLLDAFGVAYQGRSFERAHLEADMTRREGSAVLDVVRAPRERLEATGRFAFDSLGGSVHLEEVTATLDSLVYLLARPSRVSWDDRSVTMDSLEVRRDDHDHMSITADGRLSRSDISDFDLDIAGLHMERVARVVEFDDVPVSGHLNLTLSVRGPAEDPVISGHFDVEEPRFADVVLTRASGALDYGDREADVRVEAWEGERRVLSAAGPVPIDLSLAEVEDRRVARPMDVTVVADSLDAAVALAYFETLADVEGAVSGEVSVRGSTETPEPDGVLRLSSGGWSIEALGVRHTGVNGAVTLKPDRTAEVDLTVNAIGRAQILGTVTLDPVFDPALDLHLSFAGFQAVQRRDVESLISGELTLSGDYSRPFVQGDVRVDEAALYVDEFARSAEISGLSNPYLFGADTSAFFTQPLLRDLRNPFLDNMRAQVDLEVPRATWLRSTDMDVEIGGALSVSYSRALGDLVMVGDLQALRGSYMVLGRRFEVSGGTVKFLGTPGINPTLDIQAVSRIRRIDDPLPLEVNAGVGGTLTLPRVDLSSDEAGLAQSDLVSYLIFGRSSAELGSGQSAFLAGAGSGFGGAARGFVTTLFSGAIASQVGAALAQGFGIDYLSLTQGGDLATGLGSSLANYQLEIGQYVGPNTFIVIVLQPPTGQFAGGSFLGGARFEWLLSDSYTFQGFYEDQFLRSGNGGFGDLGTTSKILGVFVFREIGY